MYKVSNKLKEQHWGYIYLILLLRSVENTFFDCVLGEQAIHSHLLGLSYTMGSVHCLCIVRRIPIAVIENDCIRRG